MAQGCPGCWEAKGDWLTLLQVFTLGTIRIGDGNTPTSCFQERAFLEKGLCAGQMLKEVSSTSGQNDVYFLVTYLVQDLLLKMKIKTAPTVPYHFIYAQSKVSGQIGAQGGK